MEKVIGFCYERKCLSASGCEVIYKKVVFTNRCRYCREHNILNCTCLVSSVLADKGDCADSLTARFSSVIGQLSIYVQITPFHSKNLYFKGLMVWNFIPQANDPEE